MNPESVQKVLDFIREGAKAASGPASEAFKQVCAYRAGVALGEIISLATGVVLAFVVAVAMIPSIKRGLKMQYDNFWFEVGAPAVAVIASICGVITLVCLLCSLPSDIATIKNPAGSVLNQFVGH